MICCSLLNDTENAFLDNGATLKWNSLLNKIICAIDTDCFNKILKHTSFLMLDALHLIVYVR